jgi:hypothetical protein
MLLTLTGVVLRIFAVLSILIGGAQAHEVMPAIADMTFKDGKLLLVIDTPVEGFISGINLTAVVDTNAAPEAQSYDALRALPTKEIEQRFQKFWPEMAARLRLTADGKPIVASLDRIVAADAEDVSIARPSTLTISATLPADTKVVTVGWDKAFGALVLRQQGVDQPYTGMLEAGVDSEPINVGGGGQVGQLQTFLNYIPVGFDHILPKGLDHILFVLGLFFFSTKLRPLLWQITAFTVAHTVTLALSSLGYIALPSKIVEPLIAASIVFVAVENIWASGTLNWWRPFIVFGFGLLHGLGFASVLGEFGLPAGAFVPALIGFNVGVEFGQLAIVSCAALLLWTSAAKQNWYRRLVAVPASLLIAAVGAYWVIERTLL